MRVFRSGTEKEIYSSSSDTIPVLCCNLDHWLLGMSTSGICILTFIYQSFQYTTAMINTTSHSLFFLTVWQLWTEADKADITPL